MATNTSFQDKDYHLAAPTGPNRYYPQFSFKASKKVKRVEEPTPQEKNHLRAVKDKMKKDGYASICDQARLEENCPYLMEVKDLFLQQYIKMKEEWDVHLIEWQKLGPPVNSLNDFAHFQIK